MKCFSLFSCLHTCLHTTKAFALHIFTKPTSALVLCPIVVIASVGFTGSLRHCATRQSELSLGERIGNQEPFTELCESESKLLAHVCTVA